MLTWVSGVLLPLGLFTPNVASAQQKKEDAAVLGLSPGAPQVSALPGGVTPSFGQESQFSNDWRFDMNGYVLLPLRFGLGRR